MKRRTVLAAVPAGLVPALGGCTGSLFGCPDPDIESPLPYDAHRVVEDRIYEGEDVVELLTSVDEFERDLERALDRESIEYVVDTDFDRSSAVVVQVGSSVGSDDLEVLGVGREDETTLRTYTCVPSESGTDDWYPRTQVIRVEHEGIVPERAVGTHYRERSEVSIGDDE